MLLSVVCTSQYENLYINGCKTVYDKTEFLLRKPFLKTVLKTALKTVLKIVLKTIPKTVLKTIFAAENCFNGG